ncbi:glycosyltransferase [Pseudomonas monteilii]|uniref:glycosyltransferase n=1 Tax=Pseudomonas monteilii TaxID=76759 RepID=UPI003D00407C
MNFKILLIADAFSSAGYTSTSAKTMHVLPDTCRSQIVNFQPDLFFVESAWQGLNGAWHGKLSPPSTEILECLEFCRLHSIPTVFWNKEDPVHFGTFLPLASHFDHVATTDIDCIPRYMKALKHDRVFLLPFAAQPGLQTPLPTLTRSKGFSFAGSWYQRYPERQHDFANLVNAVSQLGPLDIFDRNYHSHKTETQFPAEYDHFIRGHLPFDQIDQAYKGYRFALNINTVKHSQSMFARRVFELMACNTIVVSNESRGMRIFFGDLVIASDDPRALENEIRPLWNHDVTYRKRCLMALRKVLSEHTYEHRLEYIKTRIKRERWTNKFSEILILSTVNTPESEQKVIENFQRQTIPCRLMLLRNYTAGHATPSDPRINVFAQKSNFLRSVKSALSELDWVSFFSAEDTYGEHYLTDLLLAKNFSNADAFGKVAHYKAVDNEIVLDNNNNQYLVTNTLATRAALIRSSKMSSELLGSCLDDIEGMQLHLSSMLGTDQFQYCRESFSLPISQVLTLIGDLPLENLGLSLANDILPIAERLTAGDHLPPSIDPSATQISASALYDWFSLQLPKAVSLALDDSYLTVKTEIADSEHVTLHSPSIFTLGEVNLEKNNKFRLIVDHNLSDLSTIIEYLDNNKCSIGHTINRSGSSYSLILPSNCRYLRMSLRLSGPGIAKIHSFVFGKTFERPAALLDRCTHASKSAGLTKSISHERTPSSAMSLSSRAQAASNSANYQLAANLYARAIAEQPEIAHTYNYYLTKARKQLGLQQSTSTISLSESPTTGPIIDPTYGQAAGDDISLIDLYRMVERFKSENRLPTYSSHPLVSILMTAHNCAAFIEESITSALRQNWPNLELIVIDDASSDSTWEILTRLDKSVGNLRCHRSNSKLGHNSSNKYALSLAKGEYVFIHNAEDLCHPDRILLMMSEFLRPSVGAVRGTYSQVDASSTNVILCDGAITRFSIDTIGLKRQIFDSIINLNFSFQDEDYFNFRLDELAYQHSFIISNLDLPLYFQTTTKELTHYNMLNSNKQDGANEALSEDTCKSACINPYDRDEIEHSEGAFRVPANLDLTLQPPVVCRLATPSDPVVVSLCSIPERAELLRQVLASLAPQVDALHIYLDRYDSIPDFVRNCHPQVTVYLSKDHPGLRDNGKFLAFSALAEDCYYFTADDDIVYPPDYVASMVRRIEDYERLAVIGVHGVLLPEQAEGYFTSFRKVHMFKKELERDALVNNLGTGTVAFHSGLLRGLDLTHFSTPGMADLHLSVFCKQRNIPMIALARPEDWLQELPSPNTSLYNEFRQADDQQSALIRAHKPWGYAAISKAVAGASMRATRPDTGERLQRLIPLLHACLK